MSCGCRCDKLSKEQLKDIINATDKMELFLNNPQAVQMFREKINPDESDAYVPEASSSHARGRSAKPKALKYLEVIEEARKFINNVEKLRTDEGEEFLFNIDQDSYECLECALESNGSSDDSIVSVLEQIISKYGIKLSETTEFKNFRIYLVQKYDNTSSFGGSSK